jgi:quercetin dioxygenase-like cupin family protein
LILALYDHPDGVQTESGNHVVYDLARDEAHFGAAQVGGHALRWELAGAAPEPGSRLAAEVELDRGREWVVRCDRIDFPPGGVAYRHTHPGGGIRRVLFGSIHIEASGHARTFGPGEAWFEGAEYPVLATSSGSEPTAFVRVLVLPAEWEGKRTIRYLDPADDKKPKLQRPTVFFDRRLERSAGDREGRPYRR